MASTERAGFEALYRANVRSVMAYVLTRTAKDEAPDVVSSTFLVAWRRFDDVPADALPWLIGVARRVLAEQSRSSSRRNAVTQRLAGEAATGRGWSADASEPVLLRGSIRSAFSKLRPEDRDILTLTAWQGLDTAQLAVSLGCSKAVASLRLHHARRRFGQFFENEQHETTPADRASVRPAREVS